MKKTTILTIAAVAAISLNTSAQAPGPWDATGGIAQTTTPHQVQIGAGAGAINAWTHIRYCNPNDYGLVVTKAFCGYLNIIDPPITYDGVTDVFVEGGGGGGGPVVFTLPISFALTGYNSSNARPMIWARQENSPSLMNPSGSHTS